MKTQIAFRPLIILLCFACGDCFARRETRVAAAVARTNRNYDPDAAGKHASADQPTVYNYLAEGQHASGAVGTGTHGSTEGLRARGGCATIKLRYSVVIVRVE